MFSLSYRNDKEVIQKIKKKSFYNEARKVCLGFLSDADYVMRKMNLKSENSTSQYLK